MEPQPKEMPMNQGKVVNLFGDKAAEQITEPQEPADDDPWGLDGEWREHRDEILEAVSNGIVTMGGATSGEEFFHALRDIREEADKWV
jgi:hypothetical protein